MVRAIAQYAGRIQLFSPVDWLVYVAWVGMMYGLFVVVGGFIYLAHRGDVIFPDYVWSVPIGIFIFSTAIAFDTIGHRTVYKEYLQQAEALVHHITIFAGITSILLLCIAYSSREAVYYPALVMTILSIFYSIVDEALHWHRYMTKNSDPVEMWSHVFIFVGHLIMVLSWWHWFEQGYPGVAESLKLFRGWGILAI